MDFFGIVGRGLRVEADDLDDRRRDEAQGPEPGRVRRRVAQGRHVERGLLAEVVLVLVEGHLAHGRRPGVGHPLLVEGRALDGVVEAHEGEHLAVVDLLADGDLAAAEAVERLDDVRDELDALHGPEGRRRVRRVRVERQEARVPVVLAVDVLRRREARQSQT